MLKEYRNRWYLIGKSELKNKVVTFGLDRIFDPIVLEANFLLDEKFNPENYFKHAIGITVYDQLPNKIIIETNPILSKYLLSQPLHHSQDLVKIKPNGNHQFSYYLLITYELKMLLMGFGKECKIIAPEEFKKEVLSEFKSVLSVYDNE